MKRIVPKGHDHFEIGDSLGNPYGVMFRAAFARIGVSIGTLRNWEQGRRTRRARRACCLPCWRANPRLVEETLLRQ